MFLKHILPWMAISGLLLAAWGLIITPDELRPDAVTVIWEHEPATP